MTMFRKVFGNHLAANGEELPVMQGRSMPNALASKPPAPAADIPQHTDAPPMPDAIAPQETLAERAAIAHRQMVETQAPPQAERPVAQAAALVPERRAGGRARTRLLGFDPGAGLVADPFAAAQDAPSTATQAFPTGWLVIIQGPGRGQHFALQNGVAMVGRGDDQAIRLDFGDNTISRQNHAAVAYDGEDNKFYLGHGGKSNIIRLNGRPVLSTEELSHGDTIRIGETTLRFVALCSSDFQWGGSVDE